MSVRKLMPAYTLVNQERVQLGIRHSSNVYGGKHIKYVDLVADECFSMNNASDRHRMKVLAQRLLDQLKLHAKYGAFS